MEEIKVNEYVRTKRGSIGKFDFYGKDRELAYFKNNKGITCVTRNEITKHSPNIIDLIEVDDYVNGERVFATDNRINDNGEKVILTENYDDWTYNGVVSNKDIKTILTKEQYKANCYEV